MLKNIPCRLKHPEKNHSVTTPSSQVMLESDSLQYEQNNTTYRSIQKLHPSRKEYLCFTIDKESDRTAQCDRSRELNKVIDLILELSSFEQQCVIIKGLLRCTTVISANIMAEVGWTPT